MKNRLTIFLFSFVFLFPLWAEPVIKCVQVGSKEGLPNSSVRCMMQDSRGFIWMGTLNGLCRYDGISFTTYRPRQGSALSLSDRRIYEIVEDKHGFLWISTGADRYDCFDLSTEQFVDLLGKNRTREKYSRHMFASNGDVWLWYDGNGARRVIYHDDQFSSIPYKTQYHNIPSNSVSFVAESYRHFIWIGTDRGLTKVVGTHVETVDRKNNFYNTATYRGLDYFVTRDGSIYFYKNRLVRLVSLSFLPGETLTGQFVMGHTWYIFTARGSYSYDFLTRRAKVETSLLGKSIENGEVQVDNKGNYWIFNHTGNLWFVNHITQRVKLFHLIPFEKMGYIDFERYHIVEDSHGYIWISTYGNGLFAYDPRTDKLNHYRAGVGNTTSLGTDFLQYVMEDRSGDIWVSQEYLGISHISILDENGSRILPENPALLDRSNTVRMICLAKNGEVWVGTRKGGLYIYNEAIKKISSSKNERSNIYAMKEDALGIKWIGTRGSGLLIGNTYYKYNKADNTSIPNDNIYCILRDSKNRMWVGTFGGGLVLAKKKGDKYTFRRFRMTDNSNQVRTLMQDNNGMIWMGTSDGVYIFNPDELLHRPNAIYSYNITNGKLLSNEIRCIVQDHTGRIWIGNSGTGFSSCRLLGKNGYGHLTFHHYTTKDGLSNDVVQSIVEDQKGYLWMSTEYGISKFNPHNGQFDNYYFSAYTLGNAYSENSAVRLRDGNILFGSNYGMLLIDPMKISKRTFTSPIVFTNLQVNGMMVRPGDEKSPLKQAISSSKKIDLAYNQNSISIDFTSFDYADGDNVKYSYKLENYDKEWSSLSLSNVAAYKNLSSGKYIFKVRSNTGPGSESILMIIVHPPFYLTVWAFILYFILGCVVLLVTFRIITNINTLHNKIAVEKHLTEYKLVFFTNISHEFRTPLTLIEGALERIHSLGENLPNELNLPIKVLDKSSKRMMRLIDQLLEFRKMQNNKLALSLEETDVVAFLYEIFLSFGDVADQKNMDFQFIPSDKHYVMFVDKEKVDKIAYNLLSNAFKYTPSKHKIRLIVSVDQEEGKLRIQVTDTGVGISKEKQAELFLRFMQSNFSGNSVGIGLHLTHELVMVHKGSIAYSENSGGGSIFTVTLPLDKSVYDEKDFLVAGNALLRENQRKEEQKKETQEVMLLDQMGGKPLNDNKILVIEDNDDVRIFLKEEIGKYFKVAVAADGAEGLEKARELAPSLIVCDVMMPGMDGFQVVKSIREDFEVSHIPVILLTALDSSEGRMTGIESGADAYITKPFSTKYLMVCIFKLIESRNALQKKFSQEPHEKTPMIYSTDRDKDFVEKLQAVLEMNISKSDFTIDDFAQKMGIGRTIFYKKVKGLTGSSPNEYIRIMRMKKAAELLLKENCTVAEVSYKVGFDDPFYFSKCFKLQFGLSPSVFQKGGINIKDKDNE